MLILQSWVISYAGLRLTPPQACRISPACIHRTRSPHNTLLKSCARSHRYVTLEHARCLSEMMCNVSFWMCVWSFDRTLFSSTFLRSFRLCVMTRYFCLNPLQTHILKNHTSHYSNDGLLITFLVFFKRDVWFSDVVIIMLSQMYMMSFLLIKWLFYIKMLSFYHICFWKRWSSIKNKHQLLKYRN